MPTLSGAGLSKKTRWLMGAQACAMHIEEDVDRLGLERVYESMEQRLGHPATDKEVCSELKITLREFHRILERIQGLELGSFRKMAIARGSRKESLVRYSPDRSRNASFVLRESEMKRKLAGAIASLPKKERLVISLSYYEELTMKEIESVLRTRIASSLRIKAILRLRGKLGKEIL
jgi:RNA polymerase sigma factor FliA